MARVGFEPTISSSWGSRGQPLLHRASYTPVGTRTRSFRVEGPASSPVRPRGHRKAPAAGLEPALRDQQSRVFPSRLHRNERKGRESNTQGPEGPPVFETGYRTHGSPSVWAASGSGRSRTCTTPIKSRRLFLLSYEAEDVTGRDRTCGGSRFRRALYR